MWEFVPCIDHPAAESFEAIDVRFGSLADHPGALSIGPTMTGVFPGSRDQGVSKPFDFITANEVGDEINEDKAFAACICLLFVRIPAAYELNFPA